MTIQIRRMRHPIRNAVTLQTPTLVCRAQVLDLNETGMRVKADRQIAAGTILTVIAKDIRIAGRVRWSQGAERGISFTPHISATLLTRLRQQRPDRVSSRYDSAGLKELR